MKSNPPIDSLLDSLINPKETRVFGSQYAMPEYYDSSHFTPEPFISKNTDRIQETQHQINMLKSELSNIKSKRNSGIALHIVYFAVYIMFLFFSTSFMIDLMGDGSSFIQIIWYIICPVIWGTINYGVIKAYHEIIKSTPIIHHSLKASSLVNSINEKELFIEITRREIDLALEEQQRRQGRSTQ